jgi:raffinose/stachyose/melibiose transport system substrate-binding protein
MKRNPNRWFLTCGILGGMLLGANASAVAQETTVTFRSWNPFQETLAKMIVATKAKLPNIKVDAAIFNAPDYYADLETRAASNAMPDVIGLEPGALTRQYQNFLMPLQDCAVASWGADWKSKFYPIAIDQARLGNPKGDENFYGLPVLTQTINAWYTIPVLKDAGVAPPKSYDDLLKAVPTFEAKGVAPMLIGAADGWLRRDVYMLLIHDIAPGLIYKAEVGEASFTDAPFVDAMRWWKRLFDDHIVQPGALGLSVVPTAMELTEGGRAATFVQGAWWQQQAYRVNPSDLSKGLVGYMPMRFPDVTGKGAPDDLLGGIDMMFGISKTAKNPKAACALVADWISGAGAQVLINTFNDLPAFKGLNPEHYENDHQREVWRLFTEDWMPKVRYARQLRSPAVKQALEDALAAVAAGDKTPEQGMALVAAAWKTTTTQ